MEDLDNILRAAEKEIQSATDLNSLEDCRIRYLGKKGQLTEYLKTLGQLPPEERPAAGQKVNAAKQFIQNIISTKNNELKQKLVETQLEREAIDISLPGRTASHGSVHPLTQTIQHLKNIFSQMGFIFMEGPEIEDDYHNFAALNIPHLHPARAMQDTFYFQDNLLLRTHMSPVQIRTMENRKPPFRIAAMGKVYRREFDLTHTPMFHQMEVLMVEENLSFADLKGIVTILLHEFFQTKSPIRFRPSYFPFTEPSAEADMACLNCRSKGCRICKNTGWLEVLGCGMVHPNVLKGVGIDSEHYQGFALGAGLDRLTMLNYGINDLRSLFENDLRFLKQF